jgi:myo-inositol 2-dehydrogenase/D-chiro-inositol 1-dehydrogenase
MATSLSDAQRIKEAAAKSKGVYNLGMNMRYGRVFKKVKEVITSGGFTPYITQVKLHRGELLIPTGPRILK